MDLVIENPKWTPKLCPCPDRCPTPKHRPRIRLRSFPKSPRSNSRKDPRPWRNKIRAYAQVRRIPPFPSGSGKRAVPSFTRIVVLQADGQILATWNPQYIQFRIPPIPQNIFIEHVHLFEHSLFCRTWERE